MREWTATTMIDARPEAVLDVLTDEALMDPVSGTTVLNGIPVALLKYLENVGSDM